MNTILTDDEIQAKGRNGFGIDPILDGNLMKFARAVEAAVLAKLREPQEPVAWHTEDHLTDRSATTYSKEAMHRWQGKGWPVTPLYTHPAPQQADRQRVPDGWVNAVQKIVDENEVEPSFVTMVFDDLLPAFMADKDAAGYVTLPLASLIESDSYDVYGSDFYRCKVCGAESGAGLLNKGIQHKHNCPLAAAPEAPAQAEEISPEFTDTARAALLWVLWHHQGGSSDVGQPIRFALGMGQYEKMNAHQVREAKRWAALNPKPTHEAPASHSAAEVHGCHGGDDSTLPIQQNDETKYFLDPNVSTTLEFTDGIEEAPAQASAVDERAEFEAWAIEQPCIAAKNLWDERSRYGEEEYESHEVQLMWKAWQARAALAKNGGAA